MNSSLRSAATLPEAVIAIFFAAAIGACVMVMVAGQTVDSRQIASAANLKNLGAAHQLYAAEWNDRQFTLVRDDFGFHGGNLKDAAAGFQAKVGQHPPVVLGWTAAGKLEMLPLATPEDHAVLQPVSFDAKPLGWFRIPNARQFNQYLNGRFYDLTFYAPKDASVTKIVIPLSQGQGEFETNSEGKIYWSSYSLSPAALYHPSVLRAPSKGGFQTPFRMKNGFQVPAMSQARYPNNVPFDAEADEIKLAPLHWELDAGISIAAARSIIAAGKKIQLRARPGIRSQARV